MCSQSSADAGNRRWQGPEKRWGAGERAGLGIAQRRLIDAARFCYARLGIASTSMEDIAAQAKVTRPTVYRYFKSRQDVVRAVLLCELNNYWCRLADRLKGIDDFGHYMTEALAALLHDAANDLSVHFLFSPGTLPHLREILFAEYAQPESSRHPIYAYALRPGTNPAGNPSVAVEWFNRFAFSYLENPVSDPDPMALRQRIAGLCPWTRRFADKAMPEATLPYRYTHESQ